MKKHNAAALAALVLISAQVAAEESMGVRPAVYAAPQIAPNDRMIAGSERGSALVATGAKDAINSPVRIFSQIQEDTKNFGAAGVVTGPIRGGFRAGGQALQGGARMLIGVLDVLTMPFGRID